MKRICSFPILQALPDTREMSTRIRKRKNVKENSVSTSPIGISKRNCFRGCILICVLVRGLKFISLLVNSFLITFRVWCYPLDSLQHTFSFSLPQNRVKSRHSEDFCGGFVTPTTHLHLFSSFFRSYSDLCTVGREMKNREWGRKRRFWEWRIDCVVSSHSLQDFGQTRWNMRKRKRESRAHALSRIERFMGMKLAVRIEWHVHGSKNSSKIVSFLQFLPNTTFFDSMSFIANSTIFCSPSIWDHCSNTHKK